MTIIKKHPEIMSEWLAYSEDKRTSGGWYILDKPEIGQIDNPESIKHFDSVEKAVSEYVVRELDFWSTENKLKITAAFTAMAKSRRALIRMLAN